MRAEKKKKGKLKAEQGQDKESWADFITPEEWKWMETPEDDYNPDWAGHLGERNRIVTERAKKRYQDMLEAKTKKRNGH